MQFVKLKKGVNKFKMEIYTMDGFRYDTYLQHHGTKGQKWGRRRYQNLDGSLTPLGRLRYGVGKAYESSKAVAKYNLKNLGKKSKLSRSERKAEKDKIREEAKSKVDEKVKKKYDAELEKYKADILKKDSLKEIMENKDIFSNAELDAIYVRKMSENKISTLQKQEHGKAMNFIESMVGVAGTLKRAYGAYSDINDVSKKMFGEYALPMTHEQRKAKEDKDRAEQFRSHGREEIMNNLSDYSTDELKDLSQRATYIHRITSQMPEHILSQPASTAQPEQTQTPQPTQQIQTTQQQTQTQTPQPTQQQTQQQTQTHQPTPTQQTQTQSQQQTQTQQQRRRRRNP